ncbi:MAG: wax ester/triacylglycerol synthase family O-acyltransferase [Corynebacteriales bacterium]|nr:wax ester/triacylglycerol synthase family O-acyltransferase [Mycobacteriales bacterium]
MPDRLSSLDASFFYAEQPNTPLQVGQVAVFRPERGRFSYQKFVELITERVIRVPRFQQKLREVPLRLSHPVWVEDTHFDAGYHVRRLGLPRPGNDSQLHELAARLLARPLDRERPLWELYFVEGLTDKRIAVITKTHAALVDGVGMDVAQALFEEQPILNIAPSYGEPSTRELVTDALVQLWHRPSQLWQLARAQGARASASHLANALSTAARPAPDLPLNANVGPHRRLALTQVDLEHLRQLRKRHGGSVNDVVLAVLTGTLRSWLSSHGAAPPAGGIVRALVPVSMRTSEGDTVSARLVDLPVGEANPILRLQHIVHTMAGHKETGQSVGADALVRLSGFAVPTLHALGARVASTMSRRLFNVMITNVPGPQKPLFAGGAQLDQVFPVMPLAQGQGLAIGVSSYNGTAFFGFHADREALADVQDLATMTQESLQELKGAAR